MNIHRRPAVALLPLVEHPVAAGAEVPQPVGLVEQAAGGRVVREPLPELLRAAGGELVGLDALLAHHGGPHDAAVPVLAAAADGHAWKGGRVAVYEVLWRGGGGGSGER